MALGPYGTGWGPPPTTTATIQSCVAYHAAMCVGSGLVLGGGGYFFRLGQVVCNSKPSKRKRLSVGPRCSRLGSLETGTKVTWCSPWCSASTRRSASVTVTSLVWGVSG